MKNFSLTIIFFPILLSWFTNADAQRKEDVVYLKNGSVIHGSLIEVLPNQSVKIQTADRNIFVFKMEEVEGFRYRAKDAWKAVTRIAIREARLKEIRQEIMNSKKLKV